MSEDQQGGIPEKNQEKSAPKKKAAKKGNSRLLVLVVLLALGCITLGYLTFQKSQKVETQDQSLSQLQIDKLQLTNELQDMLIQYDTVNTKNEKLQAEMNAQQEQIKEMLVQINRHKDDAYIISKLKKEASTLRTIMKGYLVTIDSLNTLNQCLQANNQELNQQLKQVKNQNQQLESKTQNLQQIVATGSVLQALSIEAEGIRVRNNGSQVDTRRANKCEMIKSCIKLGENRITDQGKKTIYMRIISPDGVVLGDNTTGEDDTFQFNGVSGKYSVKRTFDYQGKPMDVCIFYTVNSELTGGQYIVELYESGTEIIKTTLDLK